MLLTIALLLTILFQSSMVNYPSSIFADTTAKVGRKTHGLLIVRNPERS